MKVEANATRVINEKGNQVLIVTGQVDSVNIQPVLPSGYEYDSRLLELEVKGGSVFFSFGVEAVEGKEVEKKAPLPSLLTRQEQEEIFLKSQLEDPNLDEISKNTIRGRLGLPLVEVKDGESV